HELRRRVRRDLPRARGVRGDLARLPDLPRRVEDHGPPARGLLAPHRAAPARPSARARRPRSHARRGGRPRARPPHLLREVRPADHDLQAVAAGGGRGLRRAAPAPHRGRAVPRAGQPDPRVHRRPHLHAVGHVRQPRGGDGGKGPQAQPGRQRPLPAPVRPHGHGDRLDLSHPPRVQPRQRVPQPARRPDLARGREVQDHAELRLQEHGRRGEGADDGHRRLAGLSRAEALRVQGRADHAVPAADAVDVRPPAL
ncbi:MAG: hypothetical protein AVDCRST_MAG30-3499, partial [uncultured Solirubrobacteraceae bacterium]